MKKEKNEGITLIVLIITIIVLLILASVTIGTITGNNGTINSATKAKEKTEIAGEKETIEKAATSSMGNNKYGNIEKSELQKQLDKEAGNGKTTVSDAGDNFEIIFNDTNRFYTVDKDGNISDPKEIIKDSNPGDITKGKNGETLDGSKEHPYEIWCIEDLVTLSNMVNGTGIKLENGQPAEITYRETFGNKYVELKQNLNFKSKMSYVNSERTDFGDLNGIADDSNTLMNEMTTGTGFIPIGNGGSNNVGFCGDFNGNNNKLQEVYINREENAGLFGVMAMSSIRNLEISGNITSNANASSAGGIVASCGYNNIDGKIENCTNNAKISGFYTGGIVGFKRSSPKSLIISNCKNNGNINGNVCSGGIIGDAYTYTKVINCYNTADISGGNDIGYSGVGGIMGIGMNNPSIINSYNSGNVSATKNAGGVLGWVYWHEAYLENCYNSGNIKGTVAGGILGGSNISGELLVTKNAYFLNDKTSKGIGQGPNESDEDIKSVTTQELKSGNVLDLFNTYVNENTPKEEVDLKKWIKGENEYPVFK